MRKKKKSASLVWIILQLEDFLKHVEEVRWHFTLPITLNSSIATQAIRTRTGKTTNYELKGVLH